MAQISVFLYWPGGQSLTHRRVYAKQPYTCVVTLDETGNEVNTKITGGGYYFSWLSGSDHFYQGAAGQTTADDLDNIPTYENLTSLDPDLILSAGYEDYDDNHCILATAYLPEYDYTDKYWISLDSGLLIYFERYKDESLTMRIDMTQYLQGAPDDAVFTLPNTQLAWDVG